MSFTKSFTRFMAVATAAGFILTPAAQADRDRDWGDRDRGGWDRGDDWDDDDHRGRRGDWDDHDDRHRSWRGYDRHDRYDRRDFRRKQVVVYQPYYYAPAYYPRSSVRVSYGYSYGPYYSTGYYPRYDVGHYYSYGPRRTVYINDYSNYGLYDPPRGYHWVRDNDRGDAILASVATGAIIGLVVGAIASD